MAPAGRPGWLDRVSQSLVEHEERRESIQNYPPRYEILGEISRGGMGIVYRAWDPQLGRNVALKVLQPEDGNSAEAHERFQREAKLAAGLHHPNIVTIHDTGTWNGRDYIAMQLVEGSTLDKSSLDRRVALACIRDAARALQYAHEQGIVHRDIKPGNLMRDSSGRVYVTDFGVARQAVVSTTLTSPGTVVGTPAYMSPEQAQGIPTDGRSDVYSLGATLYELMTGRPPFTGKDPVEVVLAVRSRDPVPPRKLVPDLSKNVEAILQGAMERNPADRYATAGELADDIDRYLSGERPLRRPQGTTYRIQRAFVRHPWRSTATIVFAFLLILAGFGLGFWIRAYIHLGRGDRATNLQERIENYRIASVFFQRARDSYYHLSNPARELPKPPEATSPPAIVKEPRPDPVREEKDPKSVPLESEDQKLYKSALLALADGNLEAAREALTRLQETAADKYSELLPKLRKKEFKAGADQLRLLATKPDPPAFAKQFEALLTPAYEDQPDRDESLAQPAFQLALLLKEQKSLPEALRWFDMAENRGLREARLYEERGLLLIAQKEWDRAEHDYDSLIGHSPGRTQYPREFAVVPFRRGQKSASEQNWKEAIKQFEVAVRIDSEFALAYHDRGLARYRGYGLVREVLDQDLKDALARDPGLKPGAGYRDIVLAYTRSEAAAHWKDDKPEARAPVWEKAAGLLSLMLERSAPEDPDLLLERARMRRRQGKLAEAAEDAQASLKLRATEEAQIMVGMLLYLRAFASGTPLPDRMRGALAHFEEASRAAPNNPRLSYWKGLCRRHLGAAELDAALADFRRADELKLVSAHLSLLTARALLDVISREGTSKHWTEAVDFAARAVSSADALSEDEFVGGLFESQNRSRAEALRQISQDAHLFRGQACFEGGEYAGCVEECTATLQISPGYSSAFLWRGYARYQLKRYKEALEDFRQAARLSTHPGEKKNANEWLDRTQKLTKD